MSLKKSPYILNVRRGGKGQSLVLLHGVAGSGAIWGEVAEELEKDFDVIRLDLLGYGYSPKPNITYTMDAHLQAIHTTLARLRLTPPLTVIGLSMGSLLALEYCARYAREVDKVVCVGLPYYTSEQQASQVFQKSFWSRLVISRPGLARIIIPMVWGLGRRSFFLSKLLGPKIYAGKLAQESMMATYASFSSTLKQCMIDYRLDDALTKITQPVLFIQGGADQWTPVGDVQKVIKKLGRAQLLVIPDTSHNVVIFAPKIVADSIKQFILRF